MFFRKVFFYLLLLIAGASIRGGAGFAADVVSLNFLQKDGVCNVDASFDVAADCATAWDVLTDYDQMHQFVSGLKRSHLEEYSGKGRFLVEQEFEGGFLFVTKRVRVSLAVQEIRCQSILFEDVGHQDFEFYKGYWQLQSEPNGELKISYSLQSQQNFNEPFAGDYMKGGIKDLLDSVRKEILRRQARKNLNSRDEQQQN
jgi:carbon monoxide dehydrogenase subunit G